MNKYNNPRLLNSVVAGTGMKHPVRPHVIVGDSGEFVKGDLMDANAISELITEKAGDIDNQNTPKFNELEEKIESEARMRKAADDKHQSTMDDLQMQIDTVNTAQTNNEQALVDLATSIQDNDAALNDHIDRIEGFINGAAIYGQINQNKSDIESIKTDYATKTDVDNRIEGVVGAAPEALDTLEEIADKLKDEDDAVAAIVNEITDVRTGLQAEIDARTSGDKILADKYDSFIVPSGTNGSGKIYATKIAFNIPGYDIEGSHIYGTIRADVPGSRIIGTINASQIAGSLIDATISASQIKGLAQPDWSENDETSSSYIENRTHYKYTGSIIYASDSIAYEYYFTGTPGNMYYHSRYNYNNIDIGDAHRYIGYDFTWENSTMGTIIHGEISTTGSETPWVYLPTGFDGLTYDTKLYIYGTYVQFAGGTHAIPNVGNNKIIISKQGDVYKQLDEKYIPSISVDKLTGSISVDKLTGSISVDKLVSGSSQVLIGVSNSGSLWSPYLTITGSGTGYNGAYIPASLISGTFGERATMSKIYTSGEIVSRSNLSISGTSKLYGDIYTSGRLIFEPYNKGIYMWVSGTNPLKIIGSHSGVTGILRIKNDIDSDESLGNVTVAAGSFSGVTGCFRFAQADSITECSTGCAVNFYSNVTFTKPVKISNTSLSVWTGTTLSNVATEKYVNNKYDDNISSLIKSLYRGIVVDLPNGKAENSPVANIIAEILTQNVLGVSIGIQANVGTHLVTYHNVTLTNNHIDINNLSTFTLSGDLATEDDPETDDWGVTLILTINNRTQDIEITSPDRTDIIGYKILAVTGALFIDNDEIIDRIKFVEI